MIWLIKDLCAHIYIVSRWTKFQQKNPLSAFVPLHNLHSPRFKMQNCHEGRFTIHWQAESFQNHLEEELTQEEKQAQRLAVVGVVIEAIKEGIFDFCQDVPLIIGMTWSRWSIHSDVEGHFAYVLDLTLYAAELGRVMMFQLNVADDGRKALARPNKEASPFLCGPNLNGKELEI